jgi:hypothetical protein
MAHGQTAQAGSRKALIVRRYGLGGDLDALARLRRQIGGESSR